MPRWPSSLVGSLLVPMFLAPLLRTCFGHNGSSRSDNAMLLNNTRAVCKVYLDRRHSVRRDEYEIESERASAGEHLQSDEH